jgi:hypothetical protein
VAKWMVKAMVQGLLSCLPGSRSWNHLIQKYVTKTARLDERNFESKLELARKHLDFYHNHATAAKNAFTVLELGTGYLPVVPVALALCGAGRICTIDKLSLLSLETTKEMLRYFIEYFRSGRLAQFLPRLMAPRLDRLNQIDMRGASSVQALLGPLGIQAIVGDARRTGLEDGSIHLIFSNAVLRDIPQSVLMDIFHEFRRVISSVGVMNHYVVLEDHYADYDPSISVFNFLKYPERVWRLFNNSLHYQNRLRISDYRRIHCQTGFGIVAENDQIGSREHLSSIRLAKEFRRYTPADLCVVRSWMIAVREPQPAAPNHRT